MSQQGNQPVLIIELPQAVGFRGQIKAFLAWLGAWPKNGQLVALLGTGTLAGCMPDDRPSPDN